MESTTIVIKVKHGDTLRRFSACVSGNELGLDMGGLRDKVLDLFNFPPDSDLTLTYIDEDGDVVTLVDEEDLRDVMRQSLNPLRITVELNTAKGGRSYARSSGNSTPMRSPRIQHPSPNLNAGVTEILKSIPEPYREAFSKMSLDLVSKAASSAPGLTELVERFSRMGQSYPRPLSESEVAAGSSAPMNTYPNVSKDDVEASEGLPNMTIGEPTSKNDMAHGTATVDLESSATPGPGAMNLNIGLPDVQVPVQFHFRKLGDPNLNGKVVGSAPVNLTPIAPKVLVGDNSMCMEKIYMKKSSDASTSSADTLRFCGSDSRITNLGSGTSEQCPGIYLNSSHDGPKNTDLGGGTSEQCPRIPLNYRIPLNSSHAGLKPSNDYPFAGTTPFANDSASTHAHFAPRLHPFKRSYNHSDGMGGIFHRGVRCDGCGIHPITGPRFKSKVKEDYDLCNICFGKMGNEVDYIKMDRPLSHRLSRSFKGLHDSQPWFLPPPLPHAFRGCAMKTKGPKLDSRFIQDINVLDGTIMAPSTAFTKIWRMRNNGTMVWPQGTQLVWIGGDKLSELLSVQLEISMDGLPADHELDIAVDFISPELPGRYISYWRMASPSGQKFGQRVWVLIQVEAAPKDLSGNSFHGLNLNLPPHTNNSTDGLNLNLPPQTNNTTGPEIINISAEPVVASESVNPTLDRNRNKDPELSFPINDTLLVGGGFPVPVPSTAASSSSTVSYPIIDLSEVAASAPYPALSSIVDVPKTAQGTIESNHVEETLLRELEEMGFKQVDLNKEVLRMNEYDLEQSVDDLCGVVSEWDPILEELKEMGFVDKETNKKLLKKNNGSIKRVVMDLIAGEKA